MTRQLPCTVDRRTQDAVAIGAVLAPALHSLTDLMEWLQGGFSPLHLWLNYLAFLPVPAIMIGLYAVQRPRVSFSGLVGAVLYGFAFVYFTFTTLFAIQSHVASYPELWSTLGRVYTAHGALMICGGLLFGHATLVARVLPRWTAVLFLAGLGLNFALTFVAVDDLYQTLGTTLRNAGLVAMGSMVWRNAHGPQTERQDV
jgi:hypothetical protein